MITQSARAGVDFLTDPMFWIVLLGVAAIFYLAGLHDRSGRPPED